MDNQNLVHYLEGDDIADMELRQRAILRHRSQVFSMSMQDIFCCELASEGPQIIVPLLRMTLQVLRTRGEPLVLVLKKTAELVATLGREEAGRRNFQLEMEAERPLDDIYIRAAKLIREIAVASPQQGAMTGRQIALALRDNDTRMCALAAIHSPTVGIPAETVSSALIDLHYYKRDVPIIKIAVAVALIGSQVAPPSTVGETALNDMYEFLHGTVFWHMPALVSKSVHTRFIHLMSWTYRYYALTRATSVPKLCGLI